MCEISCIRTWGGTLPGGTSCVCAFVAYRSTDSSDTVQLVLLVSFSRFLLHTLEKHPKRRCHKFEFFIWQAYIQMFNVLVRDREPVHHVQETVQVSLNIRNLAVISLASTFILPFTFIVSGGILSGSLGAQTTGDQGVQITLHPSEANISGPHNRLEKQGTSYIQLVGQARLSHRFQIKTKGHYDFFIRYGDFGKKNVRSRVQCFLDGEPAGTTFAPDHPPEANNPDQPQIKEGRLHVQKRHLAPGTHKLELRSLTWYGREKPTEWFGPITIRPSDRPGPRFSTQDYRHVDQDPRYGMNDRYDPDAFKLDLDFYDARNLLDNGSFETGSEQDIPNWSQHGNVNRTRTVSRNGDYALTLSSDGRNSSVVSDPVSIDPTQRYELEAWYRLDNLRNGHADVLMIWQDSEGSKVGVTRAGRRLQLGFPDHRTFHKTGWFNMFYVAGPEILTGYNDAWEDGAPEIPEEAARLRVKVRVKNGTVHFDQLSVRPYTRATFKGGGSLAIPRPVNSNDLPGISTFHIRLQKGNNVLERVDHWKARIAGEEIDVQSATFDPSDNHWTVKLKMPELPPGRHFVNWNVKRGNTIFKPKGQLWVQQPPHDELVMTSLADPHYDNPLMVEFPWHESMGRVAVEQMNLIQPDVMSYLGDYSAGPQRKPYFVWRDVKLANFPVFLGTGNHENDRRNEWIFSKFFGRWKEERKTDWYDIVNVGDFAFIMLDGNYLWSGNHSLTDMNEEQLDWFQETMKNSRAALNIVMDEASIRMRDWRSKNVSSSYHSKEAKDALKRLRKITSSHRSLVLQGDRHQGSTLTKGNGSYLQVPAPARSFNMYKYAGFGLARVQSDGSLRFWDVVGLYGENSSRVYHYGWSPEKDVFPWDLPVFEIQQPDPDSLVFQLGDSIDYKNFPIVRENHGLWGPGQYTIHSGGRVIMGLRLPRLSGTRTFQRQGQLIPSEGMVEVNVTDWSRTHRRMNITSKPEKNHVRVRLTDLPGHTSFDLQTGTRKRNRSTSAEGVLTFEIEQELSDPTLVDVRPD